MSSPVGAARSTHGLLAGAADEPGEAAPRGISLAEYVAFLRTHAAPYRRSIVLATLCSLPVVAASAAIPWILKQLTESVRAGGDLTLLLVWTAAGLGAGFTRSACEATSRYLLSLVHVDFVNALREQLFRCLQQRPLGFYLLQPAGEIANVVANDAQYAAAGVRELYANLWLNPLVVVFLLGVMFYFDPLLALIVLLVAPLVTIATVRISRKARHAEGRFLAEQGRLLAEMMESLVNVKQVKAFGIEARQRRRFADAGASILSWSRRVALYKSLMGPVVDLLTLGALALMVVAAYYRSRHQAAPLSDIIACLGAAFGLIRPVKSISGSVVELQKSIMAVQRISWQLADRSGQGERRALPASVDAVAFADVGFSYDGKRRVLGNVTLELRRGDRVALVGPSGSGKTTFIDLLVGLYPATTGEILIGGIPLREINPDTWLARVGIVTQSPHLFNLSVRENLLAVAPNATEEELLAAIHLAGCEGIVSRLPRGLDTVVGERGDLLSGGERKRIALARALVRPLTLLILDEVVSELDPNTEADILALLDRLPENLIVVQVSHRRSILEHANRALLAGNGGIREVPLDEARRFLGEEQPPGAAEPVRAPARGR
jgi:ABC-type multidrug transport system fused ATPase/permease subunit